MSQTSRSIDQILERADKFPMRWGGHCCGWSCGHSRISTDIPLDAPALRANDSNGCCKDENRFSQAA